MSSVTNTVDIISDYVSGQVKKKRRSYDYLDTSLTLTHDLVKGHVHPVGVGIQFVDYTVYGHHRM